MVFHLFNHLFYMAGNFISPPSVKQIQGIAAQFIGLLHQIGLKTLISKAKGCRHPGDTAADHKGFIVH